MESKYLIGTAIDAVLENHEFTADEVEPKKRHRISKRVEEALDLLPVVREAYAERLKLIEERARVLFGVDK